MHDKNFCVDGLVFPDRTLHTGALEMKHAYRPVRSVVSGDNTLLLTNTYRFLSTDVLTVKWELCFDCEKVKDGVIDKVIAPSATAEVTLPLGRIPSDRLVTLNIFYEDKNGAEISREQHVLCDAPAAIETGDKKFFSQRATPVTRRNLITEKSNSHVPPEKFSHIRQTAQSLSAKLR